MADNSNAGSSSGQTSSSTGGSIRDKFSKASKVTKTLIIIGVILLICIMIGITVYVITRLTNKGTTLISSSKVAGAKMNSGQVDSGVTNNKGSSGSSRNHTNISLANANSSLSKDDRRKNRKKHNNGRKSGSRDSAGLVPSSNLTSMLGVTDVRLAGGKSNLVEAQGN